MPVMPEMRRSAPPGQAPENEEGSITREENARMKVHRPSEIPAQPVNAPLFTGGPVTRQTLLTPEASKDFNLGIVNFSPGARNKMHTHSSDQVLFVTAGKGIIATETEQQIIVPGDVVHIASEEKHWHGATHDSAFSHIALTAKGSRTTQVEQ
ncbi:MAG: cupin domain-containing protein [Candidatus Rokuibacteriota bacterium]|nr:MAG: cupin domain-containing protein [Candidatus Rokubacteria bacterium]